MHACTHMLAHTDALADEYCCLHAVEMCAFYSVAGAFVTALEYATGINASVIGKPEKAFFHEALKLVEVEPDKAVMIGDVRLYCMLVVVCRLR